VGNLLKGGQKDHEGIAEEKCPQICSKETLYWICTENYKREEPETHRLCRCPSGPGKNRPDQIRNILKKESCNIEVQNKEDAGKTSLLSKRQMKEERGPPLKAEGGCEEDHSSHEGRKKRRKY